MDLDLGDGHILEALHQHQIAGRQYRQLRTQVRLGCPAHLVHQHPALVRNQQDLPCPGLPVTPGILARLVHVETMVGMLDHRDAQTAGGDLGDDPLDQGGLAGAGPAGEAEDFHGNVLCA